jgi:hypothetical protein
MKTRRTLIAFLRTLDEKSGIDLRREEFQNAPLGLGAARREQRGGLERRGRERMISVFIAARSVMWCPDPSC